MCDDCHILLRALDAANRRIEELEAERDVAVTMIPPKNKRLQMINGLKAQGLSYAQIGDKLGISRQRVYQIQKAGESPAPDEP